MDNEESKQEAMVYFQDAYDHQMRGDLASAVTLYKKSIDLYPTAEAYTFLGWTYSFQGKLDAAIQECHRAIQIDPEFGNPYNDIGSYLVELGKLEEAVPWLEKAKVAKRYEARCYPYFNLGRVYETQGKLNEAINEYKQAYDINPGYTIAIQAANYLIALMN